MPSIAIIADIHSNIQALEAVFDRIHSTGCGEVYCLGDVVGYGADPGPCIDFLIQRKVSCLLGNHDALISGQCSERKFNPVALVAAHFTKGTITPAQMEFLVSLPQHLNPGKGVLMVHGSPEDRDCYLLGRQDISDMSLELFETAGSGVCFFGHTHRPSFFDGQDFWYKTQKNFPLHDNFRAMANPGSVGQPRDGDPRASFLVYDQENNSLSFERVEYDVEGARQAIIDAGLPLKLGDRLLTGV